MINQIFFGYFAAMILICSLLVVSRKNPIHSVLWMLFMFFHIAGLYLFLNAEFMAAVQIIVYAGAILVLFVFVVFLLNIRREMKDDQLVGGWPMGLALSVAVLLTIVIPVAGIAVSPKGPWSIAVIEKASHTAALGRVLYTEYLFPFEITSVILLVAIVGAVLLSRAHDEEEG